MAVPSFPLFARLYRYFAVRRPLLFGVTILLVALMGLASAQIRLQEDIEAMLPDDSSRVPRTFACCNWPPSPARWSSPSGGECRPGRPS